MFWWGGEGDELICGRGEVMRLCKTREENLKNIKFGKLEEAIRPTHDSPYLSTAA